MERKKMNTWARVFVIYNAVFLVLMVVLREGWIPTEEMVFHVIVGLGMAVDLGLFLWDFLRKPRFSVSDHRAFLGGVALFLMMLIRLCL